MKISKTRSASSTSSIEEPLEFEYAQVSALNKTLKDRESKILELQEQLITATNEINETTDVIQSLTIERNTDVIKLKEQESLIKELQNQIKSTISHWKDLEENISHLQKKCDSKDKDVSTIQYKSICIGEKIFYFFLRLKN